MSRPAKTTQNRKNTFLSRIQSLRTWLGSSKENSVILILSIGLILLLCFISWFNLSSHYNQQKKLIDTYSNTLAQLTAKQLNISMGGNNLIGLQSALNETLEQPRVINAIIYNVENKIIVQAGNLSPTDHLSFQAISVPISLDNNLLGSLTINIDDSLAKNSFLNILILIIFSILLAFLIYKIIQSNNIKTNSPIEKNHIQTSKETLTTSLKKHTVFLLIDCLSIEKLYQQLNAEARLKELDKLDIALSKILTLYSGEKIGTTANTLLITFETTSKKDSFLNALCAAYLLYRHSMENKWLLNTSSFIHEIKTDRKLTELNELKLVSNNYGRGGIIFKESAIIENNLQDIVNYKKTDGTDYLYLDSFNGSFATLLNNQLQHI